MSLIYRSLEQLRRKQAVEQGSLPRRPAGKGGKPPKAKRAKGDKGGGGAKGPGSKRILVAAGLAVSLGIVALAGVFVFREYLAVPDAPVGKVRPRRTTADAQKAPATPTPAQRAQAVAQARSAAPAPAAAPPSTAGQPAPGTPMQAAMQALATKHANVASPLDKVAALADSVAQGVREAAGESIGAGAANAQAAASKTEEDTETKPAISAKQALEQAKAELAAKLAEEAKEKLAEIGETADTPGGEASEDREEPTQEVARTQRSEEEEKAALQTHFVSQVRRNQDIRTMERRITQTLALGHLGEAREMLDQYIGLVGEDSLAALKWRGYMALLDEQYAESEDFYRKALTRNPRDTESRYNLVVALLKQDKRGDAEVYFRALADKEPGSARVRNLERFLHD